MSFVKNGLTLFDISGLLEEEIGEDDITSIRDAKNMYKSCIDEGINNSSLTLLMFGFVNLK